jgi:hypothetical protein
MMQKSTEEKVRAPRNRTVSILPGERSSLSARLIRELRPHQSELRRERSVYAGDSFSVRFSKASGSSFPGTVLSLSTLQKYDHLPLVVCVIHSTGIEMLLANSTLIDKLSHSSHRLTLNSVRGSFNGTNIIRSFDGLENQPRNFGELFTRHLAVGFDENYSRIVENTLAIKARGARFAATAAEVATILDAVGMAKALSRHTGYLVLATRLAQSVEQNRDAILMAATSDNVNLRGNAIEQIDKLLRLLAAGRAKFSFLFIAIDVPRQSLSTRLVSFLDATILAATRVQPHWAGRNSRGVTQLTGDLSSIFASNFQEAIDESAAREFLKYLIEL